MAPRKCFLLLRLPHSDDSCFFPCFLCRGDRDVFWNWQCVSVTLLGSLFTAATFSPMLCSQWLHTASDTQQGSRMSSRIYAFSERVFRSWEEAYSRALGWSLHHKKMVLVVFVGAFIFSLTLTRFVGNEFIPEEDTGDVRLTVNLPLGTRLEESDKVARRIEEILKQEVPEARFLFARTGEVPGRSRAMGQTSGTNIITVGAKLVPKTERTRSVRDVGQALRKAISQIPGVLKIDVSTGNPLGRLITGAGGKAVQVEIIGHSFEETDMVAAKIKDILEKIPGAVDVSISREMRRPELNITVDREKASSLGLDMDTIASSLKTYIAGSTATKYREAGETYDVFVRLEESSREKVEDIENLSITSPLTQQQIKLSNIASIREVFGPLEIERQNRERVVRVECNTYRRSSGK